MTTPTPEKSVEEIVEEFYKEFSYIQAVKNEKSGNAYKKIADWLTQTLQAERQKQGDAIAATEIRVREEEANEYNKIIEEAVENALVEYRQFVLNVLDGIDIAHGSCDTKAIRFALQSRTITTQPQEEPAINR